MHASCPKAQVVAFANRGQIPPQSLAVMGFTVVALPVLAALACVTSASWLQYGHDTQHSNTAAATGASSPGIKWTVGYGEQFVSFPVVDDNESVYFGTADGVVHALDGISGKAQWTSPLAQGVAVPVLSPTGQLIVATQGGFLFALAPSTGATLWSTCLGRNPSGAPVVRGDGTVFVATQLDSASSLCSASYPGTVFGVAGASGNVSWSTLHIDSFATPAYSESTGLVYLGSLNWLVALDGGAGTVAWNYSVGVVSSPAVDNDGNVFVLASGGLLHCFNVSGALQWAVSGKGGPNTNAFYSMPALSLYGGVVYMLFLETHGGVQLCALGAKDGSVTWCASLPATGIGSYVPEYYPLLDSNGNVYVIADALYAVSSAGAPQWELPLPHMPFFITMGGNGTIYTVTDAGTLLAVN